VHHVLSEKPERKEPHVNSSSSTSLGDGKSQFKLLSEDSLATDEVPVIEENDGKTKPAKRTVMIPGLTSCLRNYWKWEKLNLPVKFAKVLLQLFLVSACLSHHMIRVTINIRETSISNKREKERNLI
jgi:hypothetical protein